MSDSTASLRRKICGAGDLQSVVRTMKVVAASSIGQYEKSVFALTDYYRTVELGLGACLRENGPAPLMVQGKSQTVAGTIAAIVFGSDQGLVGQFNDVVADYAVKMLAALPAKAEVWAVGERVHERLADAGLPLMGLFSVPNSVTAITPSSGRFWWRARRANGTVKSPNSTSSTTAQRPERFMRPSASDCYRWTNSGSASWPNFPGRRETCPRS